MLSLINYSYICGIITNKVRFMNLRIKEIMSERGITSASLAKEVGISKVAVSNIITGKSSPSLDNAVEIAKCLGVSINDLLGEETDNSIYCPYCGKKILIKTEKYNIL
jgi:transcriptional regulator with XRE-family HTH domain